MKEFYKNPFKSVTLSKAGLLRVEYKSGGSWMVEMKPGGDYADEFCKMFELGLPFLAAPGQQTKEWVENIKRHASSIVNCVDLLNGTNWEQILRVDALKNTTYEDRNS